MLTTRRAKGSIDEAAARAVEAGDELSIEGDAPRDVYFIADSYEQVVEMAQELTTLA